jgi:outer membrane protein
VLPYAYGDLGRLFVRDDTFGVKLVPVGWGALEVVARVSTEGSDGDGPGLAHRSNPRPVGLGTFQETPWGGIFIDAFVDTNSGGTLLEASYAAELALGPATLYPQAGVTRRSARYVAHLYGVAAYAPGASTTPVLQLSGELPLAGAWVLLAHAQYEPFDRAVRDSPRVDTRSRASALIALAWRFK